jgi:hypothetical protein
MAHDCPTSTPSEKHALTPPSALPYTGWQPQRGPTLDPEPSEESSSPIGATGLTSGRGVVPASLAAAHSGDSVHLT